MSADYLIENLIKDDAAASLGECVDVVRRILATVENPDDPLLMIKGIYLMADEYDIYSNEYLVPIHRAQWKTPQQADTDSLLKGFWALVKSELGYHRIAKCYITGVLPQSLADNSAGGFNVARFVSWKPELATFCGLTEANITAALGLKKICWSTAETAKHLRIMKDHYKGFNFVPDGQGPLTFNTNACLEYLQSLAKGKPMKNPLSVTDSEVSGVTLRLLAASPVATRMLEEGLFNGGEQPKDTEEITIPFDTIRRMFTFESTSLDEDLARSRAAWLSHLVYVGGLTFCAGKKALRIPNLVVAERFGNAILHRHQTTLEEANDALRVLVDDGNIDKIFGLYARGMQPLGMPGRIDMMVSVPLRKQLFVLEWKSIQIDFIKIESR
ncbi:hypothetical protein BGZ83_000546 [Gryganskiella cystojenkinii]|nr:hypothetical protein BGZ83_000546 [Gryganskiella cystojenkinii]